MNAQLALTRLTYPIYILLSFIQFDIVITTVTDDSTFPLRLSTSP